jgi:hypothetical protein
VSGFAEKTKKTIAHVEPVVHIGILNKIYNFHIIYMLINFGVGWALIPKNLVII